MLFAIVLSKNSFFEVGLPMSHVSWLRRLARRDSHAPSSPKCKQSAFSPLLLELLEDRTAPATLNWTGAVSSNWSDAGNWTGGGVPSATNNVLDFTASASISRYTSTNDIAGLTGLTIHIIDEEFATGDDFTIDGNSIGVTSVTNLKIDGVSSATNLDLRMSGTGAIINATAGDLSISNPDNAFDAASILNVPTGGGAAVCMLPKNAMGAAKFNVAGGTLNLVPTEAGGGIIPFTNAVSVSGASTITLDANFDGATLGSLTVASGASLSVTTFGNSQQLTFGTTSLDGNASFDVGANATLKLAGVVSQISPSGISKNGVGALHLNAANSYSGVTNINAGLVLAGVNGALGTSIGPADGTIVASGGRLAFGASYSNTENVFLNGAGTSGANGALASLANIAFAGPITLQSNAMIHSGAPTMTLSGGINTGGFQLTLAGADMTLQTEAITGAGSVVKTGAGVLSLRIDNSYAGDTNIEGGTVRAFVDGALGITMGATNVASGAVLEFVGRPSPISFSALEKIRIVGGGIAGAGALNTFGGDVILEAPITLTGSATIGSASAANKLTLNGAITMPTIGDMTFTGAGAISVTQGFGNGSAPLPGPITPANSVIVNGPGVVTLLGNNTFNGIATVKAGTLVAANNNALGGISAGTIVTAGATLLFDNVAYTSAEPVIIAGNGVNAFGALIGRGASSFAGPITSPSTGGSPPPSIGTDAASSSLTLNGPITIASSLELAGAGSLIINGSIGGPGDLTKSGPGAVTLAAANTFGGNTTVTAGTLNTTASNALGAGSNTSTLTVSGPATVVNLFNGATASTTVGIANFKSGTGTVNSGPLGGKLAIKNQLQLPGGITASGDMTAQGANLVDNSAARTLSSATGALTLSKVPSNSPISLSATHIALPNGASLFLDANGANVLGEVDFTGNTSISAGPNPPSGLTVGGIGGAGTGILSINNGLGLKFAAGSNFKVDLNGAFVGTQYDQTNVTGGVNLNGATLSVAAGFAPAVGTPFTLIANDGADAVTGTFTSLPQGATVVAGSASFTISYTGGDGNDVVLTTLASNATTTTTLVATPLATTGGNSVMFTSTVAPSPGALGTVNFLDNGVAIPGGSNIALTGGVAVFSTTTLAIGSHPVTAAYSGAAGFDSSTSNVQNVVISSGALAPTVLSVVPNADVAGFTAAQRSRVVNLTIAFDQAVQLDQNAMTLALHTNNVIYGGTAQPAGMGTVPTTLNVVPSSDKKTWTMTFAGIGSVETGVVDLLSSLKDGVYKLTIDATKVHPESAPGVNMAANSTTVFHRLFGDINAAGQIGSNFTAIVNTGDNLQFRGAFNKLPGAGYLSYLDFNGDGAINSADNLAFRGRFNKSLTWSV